MPPVGARPGNAEPGTKPVPVPFPGVPVPGVPVPGVPVPGGAGVPPLNRKLQNYINIYPCTCVIKDFELYRLDRVTNTSGRLKVITFN